ncbi:peptidylprolyl isomerase [Cyanobacterium sp. DS4]|uniref:peptidylprolyl isomerase n=1 Tax=Cyanobacterium sp. DS4 TaxID=2878255 RepID=UPI002E823FFD|nr:peptidylprolyl isomerase [Cyanobacterium sp. Dongsha4]WVL00354.1 peptidylprolyl isomerase [Cyanobacterium sp. Dongsha4]
MKVSSFNKNLNLIVVLCLITVIGLSGCQQLNATSGVEKNTQETTTSAVDNSNSEDNLSSGETNPNEEESNNQDNISLNNNSMNLPRLEGNATVVMKINGQSVTIELDGNNAPITAGNFVDLVQQGVYNGSMFHRVIKEPQPFVAQGGDPQSKDPNVPVTRLGTGSYVDPTTKTPRYIPLEIRPEYDETKEGVTPPEIVYGQTITTAPELKHDYGVIAMARSQMPDSASAQFYFTLAELPFLDGNYAVFGRVTEGMDVVTSIEQGDRIESAEVISGAENLKK